MQNLKKYWRMRLGFLQGEFKRYFPELDDSETRFIHRPFDCNVSDLPAELQEEFIEMNNDFGARDTFNPEKVKQFWIEMIPSYQKLAKSALLMLLPFSSIYLCEQGFSALLAIN